MKIILTGCNGKMGKMLARCIQQKENMETVAGLDIAQDSTAAFPVYTSVEQVKEDADVIIDFSHPTALKNTIALATAKKLPVVLATTGFSAAQLEEIDALAKEVPVFFTANMSLGVNLLSELVKKAASILGDDFDIEIVEKHHNQKVDAPSGTALMLANAAKEGLSFEPQYVYERHSVRQKRDKKEIGISAVRAGTIVGEHDVIFGGHDEIITLSHMALSREVFAVGAINAAAFLVGKAPGMYSMKDML